jgi:tetratricopeptide (TPR) repeat protein
MRTWELTLICAAVLCGCGLLPPPPPPVNHPDMARAETQFLMGRYGEARMTLDSIIYALPDPQAFLLRGKCSLLLGDYTRAQGDFKQTVSRTKYLNQYVEAQMGLGDAYYSEGMYKQCIGVYQMLLDKYNDSIPKANVMLRYAHSLIRVGKRSRGEEILDSIMYSFPESAAAKEARGLRNTSSGDFYIQLGLFSERRTADTLISRLKMRGFTPTLQSNANGFIVVVGYFKNIDRAREKLAEIKSAGFRDAFIKP